MRRRSITDVPSTDAILAALYLGPADVDTLIDRLALANGVERIDAATAWGEYLSTQLSYLVAAGMAAIVSGGSGPRVFAINHSELLARIECSAHQAYALAAKSLVESAGRIAAALDRIAEASK